MGIASPGDENTDEATQAQQEAIENDLMKQNYHGIRRLRRDGNCFYRAFGFAYLEYLLTGRHVKEAARFVQLVIFFVYF
ncbi:unnamed protein product [Trichobilharzia regenti]|nr:unnamed protein product [Trichobilharzia regenti]